MQETYACQEAFLQSNWSVGQKPHFFYTLGINLLSFFERKEENPTPTALDNIFKRK